MADTIEKIYCTDGRDNDLAAILAATNNNDPATMMAAMGGGMNNWMNNPFVYLVWMMFANRMWGGEQNCNPAIQAQIDSLRNQMADNQNSNLLMDAVHGNTAAINQLASNLNCDFNALNGAICDVRGGVDRLSGQVGFSAERVINSVSQGNLQMIQALKDCCCQTQQSIIKMAYENQLGQKDIVNALQQGFAYTNTGIERAASNLGFQLSQGICDLNTNNNAGVQRIIDTMNCHWNQELQLKYNDSRRELSQRDQTQAIVAGITAAVSQIIAASKTPTTTP